MWRHDRGRQWAVDCGHEPLCSGAHVEGTKEQGHPDSHLLARQPRIELDAASQSCFLGSLLKEVPPGVALLRGYRHRAEALKSPLFPAGSCVSDALLGGRPPSVAVPGACQDCHPAGWKQLPRLQKLRHKTIYTCTSCIPGSPVQH